MRPTKCQHLRFLAKNTSSSCRVTPEPFRGTREAAQGPAAATIATEVANATGMRPRELLLDTARVKKEIGV